MLVQVQDIERGQRIKARRMELHLTQPAVVDRLEELAEALPPTHALHPDKAGKPPVTLRGVQTWEQGGGIAWEKAKLLAEALQTDVETMMHGVNGTPTPPPPTPDPFAGQGDVMGRLDEIETRLAGIGEDIVARLDRLENALTGAISQSAVEEVARIVDGIEAAWKAGKLPPAPPPASKPKAPARAPRHSRVA